MLSFFKSNNPGVVIFYLVYLVLFRICFYFSPFDASFALNYNEPLSKLVFSLLNLAPAHFELISLVLSGILCFIQALMINGIINENKILPKKSYMGGLIFIIVLSFFKQNLVLSPALLSLTFIILCTQKIFGLIKKEKAYGDVFDVGFLVAIASLFYFPSILLLIFAYFGLATVRPFTYKEWVIVLLGFLAPLVVTFTFYYWNDHQQYLLPDVAGVTGKHWLTGAVYSRWDWILIGELVFLTIAAFAVLPTALYSSLIQVRKFTGALVALIFLVAVAFLLQQTISLSHWVLLSLPLSIIFSMSLMQIKREVVSEVIYLILILLVLAGQYLPALNII